MKMDNNKAIQTYLDYKNKYVDVALQSDLSRTDEKFKKNGLYSSPQHLDERNKVVKYADEEKKRLEEQLQDTSHRQESWMDTAEKVFNFTVNCRYWFNNDTKDEKRVIAGAFGLNLTLEDRLLRYGLLKPFELIKQAADTLKDDAKKIEPKKRTIIAGQSYYFDSQNPFWGG